MSKPMMPSLSIRLLRLRDCKFARKTVTARESMARKMADKSNDRARKGTDKRHGKRWIDGRISDVSENDLFRFTRFLLSGACVAGCTDATQDALSMTPTVRALIGCRWCLFPQVVKLHQVRLRCCCCCSHCYCYCHCQCVHSSKSNRQ